MANFSVYLGAVGWKHAQWENDLYPGDLPEDWQLAFYNSQFRCVYLPCSMWQEASDAEVSSWLQETREGFRFVLQMPKKPDGETLRRAKRFGERGVPEGQVDIEWLEGVADLRGLAKRLQKAANEGAPLFLISRDGMLAQLRQVSELMEVLKV